MGSSVSEFGDAARGHIRGFDVRTGKLRWIFHTIPHPGEVGYDTWPEDAYKNIGGANAWSGMVLDEKRGIVYTGTGSASFDFYGGNRPGQTCLPIAYWPLMPKRVNGCGTFRRYTTTCGTGICPVRLTSSP